MDAMCPESENTVCAVFVKLPDAWPGCPFLPCALGAWHSHPGASSFTSGSCFSHLHVSEPWLQSLLNAISPGFISQIFFLGPFSPKKCFQRR